MNFRKKAFLIATTLFAIAFQSVNKVHAEEFSKERPFFISPVENEELVVDSFGDNLPASKTYTHLYSKSATFNTAQMKAYFQPENNNSFEIHMQKDPGLCFGPDVSSRNSLKNGVSAIVKRDCKNTLNNIMEGERIRVNNSDFCLEVQNGQLKQLQKLVYSKCNGSNAQRFKLVYGVDQTKKSYDMSCYRKANFLHYQYPCFFNLQGGAKSIIWTGGVYATVIFRQPDIIGKDGRLSEPGAYTHRYLNPDEGQITIPAGAVKYDIAPWNEKSTTRFTIITDK